MTGLKNMLNHEVNFRQFTAYLLHTFQDTFSLKCRRFFNSFMYLK